MFGYVPVYTQHSRSREPSVSKAELKRSTSRTDLIRQLSKQYLEQQQGAEERRGDVLIVEEKAETGSVGVYPGIYHNY